MFKSTLLLLITAVCGVAIISFDPNKNLVAHFTFNHCDARDDSGQGSFGRMVGNVRCWCGVEDEGLLFDGREAHVIFSGPINEVFNTTDFTLSFYLKPEAQLAFPQTVVSKRADCGSDYFLDISLDPNLQQLTTEFQQSENVLYRDLHPPLPAGKWFHYALVREGTYARTYINGELVRTARRCSGVDIGNDAPFSIGESPCLRNDRRQRFRGVMDELRVYDRALSEEEIRLLYEINPIENAQMDCYS